MWPLLTTIKSWQRTHHTPFAGVLGRGELSCHKVQKICEAKENCKKLVTPESPQESMKIPGELGLPQSLWYLDIRVWEVPADREATLSGKELGPFGAQGRGRAPPLSKPACKGGGAPGTHWWEQGWRCLGLQAAGRNADHKKTKSSSFPDGFPNQRRTPSLKGNVGRIPIFLPALWNQLKTEQI